MISYLEGKVIFIKDHQIILNVGGVGYDVYTPVICNEGDNLSLHIYFDFSERGIKLYGFKTNPELELFKSIREISGIGPKAALTIVSLDDPEVIKKSIKEGDTRIFSGVSGIGTQRAKKIILELSGKLLRNEDSKIDNEAMTALINLGFSKGDIKKVLTNIPDDYPIEKKISEALKYLGT